MRAAFERAWYRPRPGWIVLLLPLAWIYAVIIGLRRSAYRLRLLRRRHPGVPVLVVGNLTVGGTGKTPLVAALAARLRARGRRPGIVSRGYGGRGGREPMLVMVNSDPAVVGDEPVLLARRAACPVVVCRARARGAAYLVAACAVDVVVADDGLQHYALARDAEIAVRDGERGYGNGLLLPAGPLREPLRRLRKVNLELIQGAGQDFALRPGAAYSVRDVDSSRRLNWFIGQGLHAVAGIGYPERFFAMLRSIGLEATTHAFADHHHFTAADLEFGDDSPVLMTEKDAVKCTPFADARYWAVPVKAVLSESAEQQLQDLLDALLPAP